MKNLFQKLVAVSVCTTLSFTLGANKAVAIGFNVQGNSSTGMGERIFNDVSPSPIFVQRTENSPTETRFVWELDYRGFYTPGQVITRANVEFRVEFAERIYRDLYLDIFGYVGNGRAELSDFNAGVRLDSQNAFTPDPLSGPVEAISFDVTQFVDERLRNGDDVLGFAIRVQNSSSFLNYGRVNLGVPTASWSTEPVEPMPVPEPTTIFGSALALSLGGWLKRKNSSQQNKTKSQG
jgi:hypothetical protein